MTRLYSIGDVHEMTGLSVSALRYYADMKVVCPVRIDRQTGTAIMILMIFRDSKPSDISKRRDFPWRRSRL